MDESVTLMKRIASLSTVAGLPSGGLFTLGDILAPKGGWVMPLAVGLLMSIVCLQLLHRWLRARDYPAWWKATWWYRLTAKEKDWDWWWQADAPWKLHGIHVPLVLAILCTWSGAVSHAAAGAGGVMAQQSDVVKYLQRTVGLLETVAANTANIKRETSADPCKELANLGKTCNGETLLGAVKEGNTRELTLALEGGVRVQAADSQGRPLPVMLALNTSNPAEVLDVLVRHGVDINQPFKLSGSFGPQRTTLLGRAIKTGNTALVAALLKHGVDTGKPVDTFGAMGSARPTYPLPSAIYWAKTDIADLLIDAGADNSLGDYAAYREAHAALNHPRNADKREALQAILQRTAPPASDRERVQTELRLEDIKHELNEVALKSIRTSPYLPEKQRYERRYAELQQERSRMEEKLKALRRK